MVMSSVAIGGLVKRFADSMDEYRFAAYNETRPMASFRPTGGISFISYPFGAVQKVIGRMRPHKKRDCTEGGREVAGLSPFCPMLLILRAKTTGTGNGFTPQPPKPSQSRVFAGLMQRHFSDSPQEGFVVVE